MKVTSMQITETWPTVEERNDYQTHLKYAHRLGLWASNLSISCTIQPALGSDGLKEVKNKGQLIEMTRKSLEDELAIVFADADYSSASVLWLPTKSYYLMYHLLSVIEYILTGDKGLLRFDHVQCLKKFAERLGSADFCFSHKPFNTIFDKSILKFKSQSGEILRNNVSDKVVHALVMKKVATYKIENFLERKKIDRRNPKGKKDYTKFVDGLDLTIIDFFYSMRIKSSYSDFRFVDGVDADRTKIYFEKYYAITESFYQCFNNLKNDLIARMK